MRDSKLAVDPQIPPRTAKKTPRGHDCVIDDCSLLTVNKKYRNNAMIKPEVPAEVGVFRLSFSRLIKVGLPKTRQLTRPIIIAKKDIDNAAIG